MLVIGLTGGTGSGKTEVARVLQKRGGIIVSGDRIGKEVLEKNPQVLKRLVKVFGKQILIRNGKLNRRKLGSLAFASEKNQKKLNRIIHPQLLKELRRKIAQARKSETDEKFLVVDAALISEWGLEKELDMTVLVASPVKLRFKRLINQGLNRKEAQDRIRRQLSDAQRRRKADYVIKNDGSLKRLRQRALLLWHILMILSILDRMEKETSKFDLACAKAYIY
jgi:dephospho-CoA kinase